MNHMVTIMSSVMVDRMMPKSLMGKIMDHLPIKAVLTRAQRKCVNLLLFLWGSSIGEK